MISTKDVTLSDCCPEMAWEEYLVDCEKVINMPEVHSDEWSTDDENLAAEERDQKKRLERILNTNSIIKIYEKNWRSSRVCKIVKLLNITLYIINIYVFLLDQENIKSRGRNRRKSRNRIK